MFFRVIITDMRNTLRVFIFLFIGLLVFQSANAQSPDLRQEMLRGSITPEREWWDLQHYRLAVEFFPDKKAIKGSNVIDVQDSQRRDEDADRFAGTAEDYSGHAWQ